MFWGAVWLALGSLVTKEGLVGLSLSGPDWGALAGGVSIPGPGLGPDPLGLESEGAPSSTKHPSGKNQLLPSLRLALLSPNS